MNYKDFAKTVKAKYPDYANVDDRELAEKIVQKYPDYASQVEFIDPSNTLSDSFKTAADTISKPFVAAADIATIKTPEPKVPLDLSLRAPTAADSERLAAAETPDVFDYQMERIADNITPAAERVGSLEELKKQQQKQNFLIRTLPAVASVGVGGMPLSIAAAYEAIQQGRNLAVQKAKGEKYNPIDSRSIGEILPEGTPEGARIATTFLEMLGDTALVGKGAGMSKKVLLEDALKAAEKKLLQAGYSVDDIARSSANGRNFIKNNYKNITPEEALEINVRTRTAKIPKIDPEAPPASAAPAPEPARPVTNTDIVPQNPASAVSAVNVEPPAAPPSPVRGANFNERVNAGREIIQKEERKAELRQEIEYLTEVMNEGELSDTGETISTLPKATFNKLRTRLENAINEYENLNPERAVAEAEALRREQIDKEMGNRKQTYAQQFKEIIGGKIRIPEKESQNRGEYDLLSPETKRKFFTTNKNAITFDEAEQLLQNKGNDIGIWDYIQNIERRTATKYRAAAAMYKNPRKNISDFVDFAKSRLENKQSYFEHLTPKEVKIVIPTDTILHTEKHKLIGKDWQNLIDNFDNASLFKPNKATPRYDGEAFYGTFQAGDNHYGLIGETLKNGRKIITTFFKDNPDRIEKWIKKKGPNALKSFGEQTSQLTPRKRVADELIGNLSINNISEKSNSVNRKLTDGIKENIKEIRALNREIFGDDGIEIIKNKIFTPEGQEALGRYRDGIIGIVEGSADPVKTFNHEAAHKYIDMFMTAAERKTLFTEAFKQTGIKNKKELEDRIAEDFIDYAAGRSGFLGKLKTLFERLLNRIKSFFKKEDAVKKVYNDILSGKAAKIRKSEAKTAISDDGGYKYRETPDPDKFKDSKIVNAVQRAIGSKQAQSFKIKQRWQNIAEKMKERDITSYENNEALFNYYDNPKKYPLSDALKDKIGQDLLDEIFNFKKMMTSEQVRRGLLDNAWKDDEYMRRYIVNADGSELSALQLLRLKETQPWTHRPENEEELAKQLAEEKKKLEGLKKKPQTDGVKRVTKFIEENVNELTRVLSEYRDQRSLNKKLSSITGGSLPVRISGSGGSSGSLTTKNKFNIHRLAKTADESDKQFRKLGMKINRNFVDVMANTVNYISNITGNYDFIDTLRKQGKQGDIKGVKEIYDPKEYRAKKQKFLDEAKSFVNNVFEKAKTEKIISEEEYKKLKEEISGEKKSLLTEINEARAMYKVGGADFISAGKEIQELESLLKTIEEKTLADIKNLYRSAKTENQAAREKVNKYAREQIANIRKNANEMIKQEVGKISQRAAELKEAGYDAPSNIMIKQQLQGLVFDDVSKNAIDKFFERLKPSSLEDAVKGIKLFQATFDLFQLAEVARQRYGVAGLKGIIGHDWKASEKDFYDNAIKAVERGLVLGKNEDIATELIKRMGKPVIESEMSNFGKIMDKLNDISDNTKPTKAIKELVMKLEDLQWKTIVPNTKLSMWRELSKQYKEKYPEYSEEEAEAIAADTVNDFFQGINWDRLMAKDSFVGRHLNRNRMRMLRYFFFGPDRLAAVASRVAKSFDGPNKAEYAKAHLRGILMLLLFQNILQYALTGHFTDENTKGSELDLEIPFIKDRKGNPIAVNLGGTTFEPLRFFNKPYRYVMNKQGILPRVLGVGQKDSFRPKSFIEEIWQVATIPFALQTLAERAFQDPEKPKTGDTDLSEAAFQAVAEFGGVPTTFRTGNNKEATIADLLKGDATLYQYIMSKDLKKEKKKI